MAKIRFIPEGVHFSPEGIAERWLEAFASAVPTDKLEALVNHPGDYLWHIFSRREVTHLAGSTARTAYDEAPGAQVLFFEVHGRGSDGYAVHDLLLTGKAALDSAAVGAYPDAFIVAPDFSWTYVHSHEGDDFFCRRRP